MKSAKTTNPVLCRDSPAESEVQKGLRRMLQMRLVLAVAVFALGPLFFRGYASALYLFTGALFLLTLIYVFLLKWRFDAKLFANMQIFADVFLVTLLITLTGWENSEFTFLYIIPIITTSLFFQLRQSVSIALLSSLLHAATILFRRYHLSAPLRASGVEVFYSLYIRTIVFCMVGYLCGHLANLLKKEKEELGELKNLHHLILSNMSSGLITTDSSNAIIYANRAAEEILGLPLAKMYNRDVCEFFAPDRDGPLHEVLREALAPQGDVEKRKPELQAKATDGGKIPIGFNISAIAKRSGEPVGNVMVFSDLREVKELERRLRAADKFRAAGELAAGIAHEIRNPLASITGSIEMLAESPELSGTNKELLSVVVNESARLNGIIEDFLAYARRGNLDMKKEDLCEIVKEAITLLGRGGSLPPDIRIELVRPPKPAIISADRSHMSQVFLNLLTNAVDALDGGGTICVKIESPMSTNDRYMVTVTDAGKGMPPERLSKVFEPFFTTKKDGVGIGLCIAERIVREHNGHIDIISEEGKGTSVTIVIPADQGACRDEPQAWPPSTLAGEDASLRESRNAGTSGQAQVGSTVRKSKKTTVRLSG